MMTSTRKLLSPTHFRPIPTIVHNSLADDTQLNSIAPFCPKDISGLATDLIKSYFDKGSIEEARMLFDEMSHRDVVTWTAMITSYNSCNHNGRAWSVFCEMLRYGTRSNEFTLSAVLKTCKGLSALLCGKLVHGLAIKNGTQGSSIYVDNALMDVYATCCSSMDSARMVFESILNKNAVSWTTLITGYTHRGDAYGGLRAFRQMLLAVTRVKPYICTMPLRMDDRWNQIQLNLADFTKRAYGTNYMETLRVQVHANCCLRRIYFSDRLHSEEELPPEFKLYLPMQVRDAPHVQPYIASFHLI